VLPAFADSHEHLMEASRNTLTVPVERARRIDEFTAMIVAPAGNAAPGGWVHTSMAWHESNLAENRLTCPSSPRLHHRRRQTDARPRWPLRSGRGHAEREP
jgi:predicted amidohydrolase YtcJ